MRYCLNNFYSTVDSYGSASGIRVAGGSVKKIQTPVAKVATSSTLVFYDNFSNAMTNWTDGSTLTLLVDITVNASLPAAGGSKTLDLNGYGIRLNDAVHNQRLINISGIITMNDSNPDRTVLSTERITALYLKYPALPSLRTTIILPVNAAMFLLPITAPTELPVL